tara:strand:- start:201 stop:419 length:219 start_codon:yes stop_codon:yes gene_type:complete
MSIEKVLPNNILEELRTNGLISNQEVVISVGDLYYAKDILSNKKRIVENAIIDQINNITITENSNNRKILKG